MEHLVKSSTAVITGEDAESPDPDAEAPSVFAELTKPCIVYVSYPGGGGDGTEKLEQVVFKTEKIGLASKAFRTIKIAPENAEIDAILGGHGKAVPRLLIVDPLKEKVQVLEKGKLKAGSLYGAMKKVAGKFYKENLDKTVKAHLKLLTQQDQLVNEAKVLSEKQARLQKDGAAKAKMAKVEKELAEVKKELEDIKAKERELWTLTPKKVRTTA